MNDKNGLSPSLVETIAGFTAGVCSTLVVHPLDIVKTRLQVDRFSSSRIGSSLRIIRGISRNEGGIQAFYRGLTPNLVGNSVSWGLYFLWYGEIKELLSVSRGSGGLTSLDYFVASGTSGVLTTILTNPIWVIKTRMLSTGAHVPGAYRSMMSGFQQIYRMEGFTGFYQGLIPAMFGVCHGALQFMAYEQLKRYRTRMTQASSSDRLPTPTDTPSTQLKTLSNMDYLLLSGTSKIFAGGVTYPYQVLRARLQTYDARGTYKGVRDAFAQILRTEGLSGFYKGLGPNLVRVLPSTWVTFLVYENTRVYLMVNK
ncbi:mitochondrial folate carrier protein [Trichophyton violaceum]|uniref:Mitochondrial folate carrier protein n=1 Tax=Trichophyton violaceum TaxID=34388 RepID=A0A178F9Y2_TRIVO|nr:mitochondrial folate carrier protein [Trichophyton violaceum]